MEKSEKFLPIGTVVMLKNAEKRVMIVGFGAITEDDTGKIWDYIGCLYPEGILKSDQTFLFDHEQIEKLYHIGYIDDEEISFKEQLKELLDNKKTEE